MSREILNLSRLITRMTRSVTSIFPVLPHSLLYHEVDRDGDCRWRVTLPIFRDGAKRAGRAPNINIIYFCRVIVDAVALQDIFLRLNFVYKVCTHT